MKAEPSIWSKRLRSSMLWQFLPLLLIGISVLTVVVWKSVSREKYTEQVSGFSDTEGQMLCNRFCDALLVCYGDSLSGVDDATRITLRSACYTGCRKHEDKLKSCEMVLNNGNLREAEQCTSLAACLK